MPVNPPFQLIPQLAELRQKPSAISLIANQLSKTFTDVADFKMKQKENDSKTVASLLTNFDLKPTPDGSPPTGTTALDMIKALNRGRVPDNMPPALLGLQAVPRHIDTDMMHLLPALLNHIPPGTTTPLQGEGGLLPKGTLPNVNENISVSGKATAKSGGSSNSLTPDDKKYEMAVKSARMEVDRLTKIAQGDPASMTASGASKYPVLNSGKAKQIYMDELKNQLSIQGFDDKQIGDRLKNVKQEVSAQDGTYKTDIADALQLVKSNPKLKQTIMQRLTQHYPNHAGEISTLKELR